MSHHFNVDFAVIPPGKEPMSKKLQRNTNISTSAKKKEIRQLEFDNSQMEWRLDELKKAMTKEKEDRGKKGFIWKSGRNGNLDSYARSILGRSVSATTIGGNVTKQANNSLVKSAPKTKNRVRVLKDEPLDLPSRDSQAKELVEKLKMKKPVSPQKQQKPTPEYASLPNQEEWITVAPDRSSNDSMELQSDMNGNILLSSIQAIEPTAVGIYFVKWGRKRLLMAVDGVIRRPKTGWGNDTYFPYAGRLYAEMLQKPEPPLQNISNNSSPVPTARPPKKTGGALLKGAFKEDESAASFQQALNNWRQNVVLTENQASTHPQMSVHVVQSDEPNYEVEFSQTSTLSYMERILLNKHRQSEIPPMPGSLIDKVNGCLEEDYDSKEEYIFTSEELEEREGFRRLFTPEPAAYGTKHSEDKSEVIIYEVDENGCMDETEDCIIEESPSASPVLTHRSINSVVIEEMQFTEIIEIKEDDGMFSEEMDVSNKPNTGIKSSANWQNNMKTNNISADKRSGGIDHAFNSPASPSPRPPPGMKAPRSHNGRSTFGKHKSHSSMEMDKNNGITRTSSTIVTEIGKLPINPDALYRHGLDDFFTSESPVQQTETNILSSIHDDKMISTSTLAKESSCWNPIHSVSSPVMYIKSEDHSSPISTNSITGNEEVGDELLELALDSNILDDLNQEDENTLNELEWELASRTGNITADGRISRIIDEWSDDGDLDIIDDPGLGSGLSTPDIDRKSLSTVNTKYSNEGMMALDFQNMENVVMADLDDDYASSNEEL